MADVTDPSDIAEGTVALTPERAWDMPAGPHTGHGAALVAPRSEGPASFDFRPNEVPCDDLIAQEPTVEPLREMELGTESWEPKVRAWNESLNRPIAPPPVD